MKVKGLTVQCPRRPLLSFIIFPLHALVRAALDAINRNVCPHWSYLKGVFFLIQSYCLFGCHKVLMLEYMPQVRVEGNMRKNQSWEKDLDFVLQSYCYYEWKETESHNRLFSGFIFNLRKTLGVSLKETSNCILFSLEMVFRGYLIDFSACLMGGRGDVGSFVQQNEF